jgi:hypothetical protein
MLVVPSYITTHNANITRHPVIGFELQFSTIIRIATHGVVWNGMSFFKAGLKATNFKTERGGIQSGRIEFINQNFTYTNIVFAEAYSGIPVNGYLWWGDGPFASGDEIKFFKGEIVRPVNVYDTIVFELATLASAARQIPSFTASPPDINYLPYPGQVFSWKGDQYEVIY